ncbi:hypothetical protein Aple_060430 [Acrocarpospora pleiomorpha]|uniref:Uncharacterized protein n=1 Tax=Acrocarpospora pleiomorpha TaxID=90975 RepID=A0A5M3XPI1_9ACTN|nr:hypothetical protein Aple_060430 [Acrocarpospora pleiomorpha]
MVTRVPDPRIPVKSAACQVVGERAGLTYGVAMDIQVPGGLMVAIVSTPTSLTQAGSVKVVTRTDESIGRHPPGRRSYAATAGEPLVGVQAW